MNVFCSVIRSDYWDVETKRQERERTEKQIYQNGFNDGYNEAMRQVLGEEEYKKYRADLKKSKDEWFDKLHLDPDGDGIGEW